MRKFAELPFHLIGSNRVQDLCDNVLFNYHWLHSKISAVPIMNILEDFSHALTVIKDPILRRQVRETSEICCLSLNTCCSHTSMCRIYVTLMS